MANGTQDSPRAQGSQELSPGSPSAPAQGGKPGQAEPSQANGHAEHEVLEDPVDIVNSPQLTGLKVPVRCCTSADACAAVPGARACQAGRAWC